MIPKLIFRSISEKSGLAVVKIVSLKIVSNLKTKKKNYIQVLIGVLIFAKMTVFPKSRILRKNLHFTMTKKIEIIVKLLFFSLRDVCENSFLGKKLSKQLNEKMFDFFKFTSGYNHVA